jgi:hypothetical protein
MVAMIGLMERDRLVSDFDFDKLGSIYLVEG